MTAQLLKTSLQIPPLSPQPLAREALTKSLQEAAFQYKLIYIAAPAGYGKTTLLTQFAHNGRQHVAWLSAGEDVDEPLQFLRGLYRGWQELQPQIGRTELGRLLGSASPEIDTVLAAFLNTAVDVPEHTVFIIDDIHLITDPAVHQALTTLLDRLPPRLHFVLAGRADPPLPLARYRARNEMREIRTDELQFSAQETADFLHQRLAFDLDPDNIEALHRQLQGWPAGVQLAMLSLRRRRELPPDAISGRHRYIADYLGQEIIARQSDEVQHFLRQTSILDRLCASLCTAVTGLENSQEMLDYVERENLFLQPLDERGAWFRYHPLFGAVLRADLQQGHSDEVAALHARAARWYLAHDLPDPSFRHAVAAEDIDLVIEISEQYLLARLVGGQIRAAQRWLDMIPEAWRATEPILGLYAAGVLLTTGQIEACARRLDQIEEQARREQAVEHRPLAKATAMRCYIACFHNDLPVAQALADRALQELAPDDVGFRSGIYGALGDTYRHNSYWQEAEDAYLKLLALADNPAFRVQAVHVYGALADLNLRQGRLREAGAFWQRAMSAIDDPQNWGNYPLPLMGWVAIRLGELFYEWDDVSEAWKHVAEGLQSAELGGDVRGQIAGYLIAGRIKLTQGDTAAAATYLESARPLVEQAEFADWHGRFERLQLELWLAQDKLRAAVSWSDERLQALDAGDLAADGAALPTVARALIMKGDAPASRRARRLLDRLIQEAQASGRTGLLIEALALQALAYWRQANAAKALTSLEQALRLAEPQGYVRLFADLGLPMARLLQEAQARGVMPQMTEILLAAIDEETAVAGPPALPDPLTAREEEILELLAAGLTNREIAEALVIAPGTVKKHSGHIYSKLGVHNRTEAAARARDLNLLD